MKQIQKDFAEGRLISVKNALTLAEKAKDVAKMARYRRLIKHYETVLDQLGRPSQGLKPGQPKEGGKK